MASPVYIWFNSEVSYWRNLAATCWAIICLPLQLAIFMALSGFSITHPLLWLNGLISLEYLVSLMILAFAMVTLMWFSLPYFSVVAEVETSPLNNFLGLFRWSRLPLLIISSVAGAVSTWCLSALIGSEYASLTSVLSTRDYERLVLNEHHLFLVLVGIFTGASYFGQFFSCNNYHLSFPIIQRLKLSQIRSEIPELFWKHLWRTLHTLKYFYISYFLFGNILKTWIRDSFNISSDPRKSGLDTVMGMLSVSLFWQVFLSSLLLMLSWSLANSLLRIFLSEHLEFPVESILQHTNQRTLSEAMSCTYSPLLQHLGFYDFSRLAKFSPSRRQELLSLSQPGGHPRIWAAVSAAALGVVKELSDVVREDNWAIMSRVPVSGPRNGMSSSNPFSHSLGDGASTSMIFRGDMQSSEISQSAEEEKKKEFFMSKWRESLKNLPILSQLLAHSPDTQSRQLFAACQLQIWAIEGLTLMAVASYKEDKYGVVQGSLAAMLSNLLDLYEAVEKHFKLTSSIARRPGVSGGSAVAAMRFKLHSVTKAALYRVVNTYRNHLEDIRLSPEYLKKLQPFVDCFV